MPTAEQQILIDKIARALQADDRIAAAWLSGSLGSGQGDEWSDVDALALVHGAGALEVGRHYAVHSSAITETVFAQPLYGGAVVHSVTPDWQRFDLSFTEAGQLSRYDFGKLTLLFSKGELPSVPDSVSTPPLPSRQERIAGSINEFIRVLGLLPLAMGREEYINSLTGIGHLRQRLIELMIEENEVEPADRGGALHLNRLLTVEQRKALEGLPPLAAQRQSLIEGNIALASLFFPRAKALATKVGIEWPQAFETATRRHIERKLGVQV